MTAVHMFNEDMTSIEIAQLLMCHFITLTLTNILPDLSRISPPADPKKKRTQNPGRYDPK